MQRLAQLVDAAYRDGRLEGREPDLDEAPASPLTEAWLDGFTVALRAEISRQGRGAGEVDAGLGWPEGRTEGLLADPGELTLEEAELLCEELGTSMYRLFSGSEGNSTAEEH